MVSHSLIIRPCSVTNEVEITYMYNIQFISATYLHAWIQEISPGGMVFRPNVCQGFQITGGGYPIAIFYRNLCFPGLEVRTSSYPLLLNLRRTNIHVSLCNAFKSHKNVAGSEFSKGIGGHGHLKILCRPNHIL